MTWLIIDGNNWFAQCDYASPDTSRANFEARLRSVYKQIEPTRVIVAWDEGESWRCKVSDSYKAHRGSKPDGYAKRLRETRESIEQFPNVESFYHEGFEADDVIATCVAMAIAEGVRAIIFSADKDVHQLLVAGSVTQVTKVNRVDRDRMSYWTMTADKLAIETGIKPWQWVDYRTIVGDASDGIKGVEGLGPKVGRIVIEHYGTLERFYQNPLSCSLLTKRQVALLVNAKSDVDELQRLLRLVDDVPLAIGVV